MSAWPQPEWFREQDQYSAGTETGRLRDLSNRGIRPQIGERADAMPISRAQLLLQYLIAIEHSARESQ
jgi:hypothetical protein